MTISTTTSRWTYTGNGVTVAFAYTNRIFAAADLEVYVAGSLKTLGPDYSVSGVGAAGGGTVTFAAAPANGASVAIVRAVPATQAIDFVANEILRAETLELGLDKATVLAQQIMARLARGLFLGESDPTGTFAALPVKSALAGKVLGFDGAGEPVATDPGAGGAPPTQAFGTVAVSGQSSVVADAAPDTLTLAGSNGIAVTTNASTDTVTVAPNYGSTPNTVCQGNDSRLSDARAPTAHTHSAADLTDEGDFYGKTRGAGLSDNAGTIAVAYGSTGSTACVGNDARLSDQRTPNVYDILCGIVGKPSNAEVVLLFVAPRAFRIPANATGSYLKAGTAATGSSVFSIQKNGAQFLTATVAGAGTTASFSSSQTDFAAGDVLKIVAPSTADATLADIAITLAAVLL